MRIKDWLYRIFVVAGLTLASSFSQGQGGEQDRSRWVGEWELNLSKSSFGSDPPRSDTRRFSIQDGMLVSEWNVIYANGNQGNVRYASRSDGQDYPVTGSRSYDAVSMTPIGGNGRSFSFKSKGKVVASGYVLMSADGKSWTGVTVRLDDKGNQTGISLLVFDKK